MNFSEGSYYKLQKDYYEHIKLECTYVEGSTVWFISRPFGNTLGFENYKLNKKTCKLYIFNTKFGSWDNVENTLSEYGAEDRWSNSGGYQLNASSVWD